MPLKAVLAVNAPVATVIISGLLGTQGDTSMAESSEQLVEWYKKIIT